MHLLELEFDLQKATEHAETADRRMKDLDVVLPIAAQDLPARQGQGEGPDMITETAHRVVVLAVDIHGRSAAHTHVHGSRHDRRPPSMRDGAAPQLADRHPRLHPRNPGVRVERKDLVEAGEIHHLPTAVHRGIAIAATRSPQAQASTICAQRREHL